MCKVYSVKCTGFKCSVYHCQYTGYSVQYIQWYLWSCVFSCWGLLLTPQVLLTFWLPVFLSSCLPLVLQSAQSSSLPVVQTVLSTVYFSLPLILFPYHIVILCIQCPSDLLSYSIKSISFPVQTSKLLWFSVIPPLILVSYCHCFLLSLYPAFLVVLCNCVLFFCIILYLCHISLFSSMILVFSCSCILLLLCSYTLLIFYPRLFVIVILCLLVLDSTLEVGLY